MWWMSLEYPAAEVQGSLRDMLPPYHEPWHLRLGEAYGYLPGAASFFETEAKIEWVAVKPDTMLAHLLWIGVDQNFQSLGHGRVLLNDAIRRAGAVARQRGHVSMAIYASVHPQNEAARSLFESSGWELHEGDPGSAYVAYVLKGELAR